jgi:hypothetical protein
MDRQQAGTEPCTTSSKGAIDPHANSQELFFCSVQNLFSDFSKFNIIHFVFVHLMQVLDAFQKFGERLQKAGEDIKERNAKTESFPNRWGPTKVPYTLLYPKSDKPGLTGMGVPNSISI